MLILTLGCTQQAPPINPPANNSTACTAEAKICPDGSAVGRTGPNCDFAPCPQIVGNDSDIHGCKASAGYSWCDYLQTCVRPWETPCPMNVSDALGIAMNSSCIDSGNVTDVGAEYNNNSNTWWLPMQITRPGCDPACVVFDNGSAEVNWRCTGAIIYTVNTANSSLGEILVDGNGYTLYTFSPDSVNQSTCTGGCANAWPPLLVKDTVSIPSSLPGTIGAFARMNNLSQVQVTYNGMPLYTYAGDSAPGDTNGQGSGGKWYVVHPAN